MPLNPNAFITLPQIKAWFVPAVADASLDTVLERVINGVCSYVERRTGRIWKAQTLSIVRSGDGTNKLLRLERPINSVTSLTIDGVALAPSEFWADSDKGRIVLKARTFTPGIGNVALTYEAGYADVDAGAGAIFTAALDLVKSHADELQNGTISVASIVQGPVSTTIRPGFNPRIDKFLDSLRDVRA
jgi:hypothetical protein